METYTKKEEMLRFGTIVTTVEEIWTDQIVFNCNFIKRFC